MSQAYSPNDDQELTLDPPGSIAVVGGGALGIEAALYGRFLGYDVTLIEAVAVGQSLMERPHDPLPMLPHRCLSPLAVSALRAQQPSTPTTTLSSDKDSDKTLPTTCGNWVSEALLPLTQSDLLRGRLRVPWRVTEICQIAVQAEADEDTSDIPLDFRLTLTSESGQTKSIDVEAVVLAVGDSSDIQFGFDLPTPYLFRVGAHPSGHAEQDFQAGLRQIVALFAQLAGRADLDLYRPRRV